MGLYICTRRQPRDLVVPKGALINRTLCSKCNQPYSWRIGQGRRFADPNSHEQQQQDRAAALFEEYRRRGIGPCCANPEHRNFISQWSGGVVYY